jgi:hypothetical protein
MLISMLRQGTETRFYIASRLFRLVSHRLIASWRKDTGCAFVLFIWDTYM